MGSCDTSPSLLLLFGVFNLLLGPLHLVKEHLFHTDHSKRWFLVVFTWAFQTYHTKLSKHNFVYDVEKSLYTLEGLPQNKHEFTVVLDDITSTTSNSTTANCSSGTGVGNPDVRRQFLPEMEVLSVLDIILRQHASRKCLYDNDSAAWTNSEIPIVNLDPRGGVLKYKAFHSIFITVQDGLSLNVEEVDSKKFYRDLSFLPKPLSIVDFSASNSDGTNVRVAYQGVPGEYSETVTLKVYPECVVITYDQFKAAFKAIELWLVDKIVLPIKHALGGSIHQNYDLLLRHGLHILGEIQLAINHCLLGLPGALAQCKIYLTKLGVVRESVDDTAGAAQFVALNHLKDTGAVTSAQAANIYGLKTLENGKYDDVQILKSCCIKTDSKFTQVKGRVLSDPKLGGLNSMLTTEHGLNILVISKAPVMMLGMDVSHGFPGQADMPSISKVIYL
ncbi:hypothetical protein GIB67_032192 [Kingdonia uniflora]|uniref:Prephenate dehydratase domain-containing protein n=1 Tax=Kingdonia uniflora TaxID=39325 RepID=A0A7J7MWV4_9MAGN|nr:hypothetical protein GIB67_032192 [Kingdonia uniflora]